MADVPDDRRQRARRSPPASAIQSFRSHAAAAATSSRRAAGARPVRPARSPTRRGRARARTAPRAPAARPLDDAQPEQEEQHAVEDAARVEAPLVGELVDQERRPDPEERRRGRPRPARSSAGAPRARRRAPRRRRGRSGRSGARASSSRRPRRPARSAAPPASRRRPGPRRRSSSWPWRMWRAISPTTASSESGMPAALRYVQTRSAMPTAPAAAKVSAQGDATRRSAPASPGAVAAVTPASSQGTPPVSQPTRHCRATRSATRSRSARSPQPSAARSATWVPS